VITQSDRLGQAFKDMHENKKIEGIIKPIEFT